MDIKCNGKFDVGGFLVFTISKGIFEFQIAHALGGKN
jgi:hypothetical protein